MVPTLAAWQQQIIGIVKRLTDSYGADGIFLDSYGWRMNYPMYSRPDKHQCWPADYARGVLKLVDLVARTIGSGRVVLVETPSGPVGHHCHGGVSADFGWPPDDRAGLPGTTGPSDKIIASPVRYGLPEIRFFSNGGRGEGSLNRLHQIYAAGHGLALCHQHLVEDNGSHAAHIKELVELRRQHADALIHGQQIYQPKSLGDSDDVAAYCYRARTGKAVLTAVNTGDRPYSGALRLGPEQAGSTWYSVLSGHSIIAQGQDLPITLAAPSADTTADLAVLLPPDWLVPTMHLIAST
jgi:hypothetical protein